MDYSGNFPDRDGRYRRPFEKSGLTTGADMLIAILNQSTMVSDQDAATMTQAQTEALFAQASS